MTQTLSAYKRTSDLAAAWILHTHYLQGELSCSVPEADARSVSLLRFTPDLIGRIETKATELPSAGCAAAVAV